jgi:hypothetical protein
MKIGGDKLRCTAMTQRFSIPYMQVHALYTPGVLEYDQHESSFVSRKSSHFDTNILEDEPTTHDTLFSDKPYRSNLMRTSSVIGQNSDKHEKPTTSLKDNESSFVSRSNELPVLPISPVPRAQAPSLKRTPLKSSPFSKSVHSSQPSSFKSQNHPERLVRIVEIWKEPFNIRFETNISQICVVFKADSSVSRSTSFTPGTGVYKTTPHKYNKV